MSITKNQLIILQNIYKTDKKISDHLEVTPQYIHNLRKKYQIEIYPASRIKEYRDNELFLYYKNGMSRKNLMVKYDISYVTVRKTIRRKQREFND